MGTVYVYTSKLTTDLNLFYSLGDQPLFLSLQVPQIVDPHSRLGSCLNDKEKKRVHRI